MPLHLQVHPYFFEVESFVRNIFEETLLDLAIIIDSDLSGSWRPSDSSALFQLKLSLRSVDDLPDLLTKTQERLTLHAEDITGNFTSCWLFREDNSPFKPNVISNYSVLGHATRVLFGGHKHLYTTDNYTNDPLIKSSSVVRSRRPLQRGGSQDLGDPATEAATDPFISRPALLTEKDYASIRQDIRVNKQEILIFQHQVMTVVCDLMSKPSFYTSMYIDPSDG